MSRARLRVLLHDTPVGELSLTDSDGSEFRLFDSYRERYPRPVLGQVFLDDLDRTHHVRNRIHAWFSNLLPEGALREFIATRAGVPVSREFFLLRHLGADLPGAVRVVGDDSELPDEWVDQGDAPTPPDAADLRFSLAGVQLKFSANRAGRGLTVPVHGLGGDWIVKLPDQRFAGVPRVELATLRWAAASGIDTPEAMLTPIADIAGLPASAMPQRETEAFAIKRFDRPQPEERVHIEDFAQVFDQFPEQKYERINYDTLARFILATLGERALLEFLRRLVFVIASGNGDAHLKNWSLIYPDGTRPRLTPAYDQVATTLYMHDDKLALNLVGNKDWRHIDLRTFARLAQRIDADVDVVTARVRVVVDEIRTAWQTGATDFGFTAEERARLDAHMASIPLLRSA